jgi:hypothetical protein
MFKLFSSSGEHQIAFDRISSSSQMIDRKSVDRDGSLARLKNWFRDRMS